jgi:hypothetical protein
MESKTFSGINGPYLTVFVFLRLGRLSVCVHHFHRGDEERDCHDHPFSFLSLVLRGAYREHLFSGASIERGWLSLRWRSALHRHRIELIKAPLWTLCIKWAKGREWGFWPDGVFIPWRDYIRSKGLTPLD